MSDPEAIRFEPCDVILATSTGIFSQQIRWWTRRFGENRTRVSHAALCVEGGSIDTAVLHDALAAGKRHWRGTPAELYVGSPVAVFRPLNLVLSEKAAIIAAANEEEGRLRPLKWDYNYKLIAASLGDSALSIFGDVNLFKKLIPEDAVPVCSFSVARLFWAAGRTFGVEPRRASPDDIWDFIIAYLADRYVQTWPVPPTPSSYMPPRVLVPVGRKVA